MDGIGTAKTDSEQTRSTKTLACRCPNCGGVISYEIGTHSTSCSHCDTVFDPRDFPYELPLGSLRKPEHPARPGKPDVPAPSRPEPRKAEDVEDFLERAPWVEPDSDSSDAAVYACPSCGVRIVAFKSVVTATCPYCGNNLILWKEGVHEAVPDFVVPFELDEQQVREKLEEHLTGKWYLDRRISLDFAHLQAVYVPFYICDRMSVKGEGYYLRKMSAAQEISYTIDRVEAEANLKDASKDGSSRMPDDYMESIVPFNENKREDFSTAYIVGQLAEVPDMSKEACVKELESQARDLVKRKFEEELEFYDQPLMRRLTKEVSEIRCDIECDHSELLLGAFPVWLAHFEHERGDVLVAVNGQTGKVASKLPCDEPKRKMTVAALYAGAFALSAAGIVTAIVNWMIFLAFFLLLVLVVAVIPPALFALARNTDKRLVAQLDSAHDKANRELKPDINGFKTNVHPGQIPFKSEKEARDKILLKQEE